MILTTPFHERTSALNETGLWNHWAGHLSANRYQVSDKFEYFAVRNAAGIFDTSPLFKYRIAGADAERYLSGILARDVRSCPPQAAQYTTWLDERGFVLEDGVVQRRGPDEYLLTSAEPNYSYLADRIGRLRVDITDVSLDIGALAVQGPRSRDLLTRLVPSVEAAPVLRHHHGHHRLAAGDGVADRVYRRSRLRDLGRDAGRDHRLGCAVGRGRRLRRPALRAGGAAHAAHRGGLLLLPVDFDNSRFAFNDAHRSTPIELGWSWMFKGLADDDRPFIGRAALLKEIATKSSRWRMAGLVVDWEDYDRVYTEAGLIPPKEHTPVHEDWMVYDDDRERVGYATSFMYSPILQRHIALARVRPDLAKPGTRVFLEFTVDHRYQQVAAHVARLPLYNPPRKMA